MELFETFDRDGNPRGLVPRDEVHARGLWHKSTHVFVYDPQDRLLIQRRSQNKDLYPGLWDYSVGEHLLPGESFLAGAHRGLAEELSIRVRDLEPLGEPRWSEVVAPNAVDREIQQAYRTVYVGDEIEIDPVEVAECTWASRTELAGRLDERPHTLTPWFARDLRAFDLL